MLLLTLLQCVSSFIRGRAEHHKCESGEKEIKLKEKLKNPKNPPLFLEEDFLPFMKKGLPKVKLVTNLNNKET